MACVVYCREDEGRRGHLLAQLPPNAIMRRSITLQPPSTSGVDVVQVYEIPPEHQTDGVDDPPLLAFWTLTVPSPLDAVLPLLDIAFLPSSQSGSAHSSHSKLTMVAWDALLTELQSRYDHPDRGLCAAKRLAVTAATKSGKGRSTASASSKKRKPAKRAAAKKKKPKKRRSGWDDEDGGGAGGDEEDDDLPEDLDVGDADVDVNVDALLADDLDDDLAEDSNDDDDDDDDVDDAVDLDDDLDGDDLPSSDDDEDDCEEEDDEDEEEAEGADDEDAAAATVGNKQGAPPPSARNGHKPRVANHNSRSAPTKKRATSTTKPSKRK